MAVFKKCAIYESEVRSMYREKNDCAVRSLVNATGIAYADAHKAYAKRGRRERKGTPMVMIEQTTQDVCGPMVKFKHNWRYERPTMAQFARQHPKGRFIVITRGHAQALVDGEYIDGIGPRAKVTDWAEVQCLNTYVEPTPEPKPAPTRVPYELTIPRFLDLRA